MKNTDAILKERIFLTPEELAERWLMSIHTLDGWRSRGIGPRFVRFGKHVRYPLARVEEWELEQEKGSTAEVVGSSMVPSTRGTKRNSAKRQGIASRAK